MSMSTARYQRETTRTRVNSTREGHTNVNVRVLFMSMMRIVFVRDLVYKMKSIELRNNGTIN
jgi:hypothetical protein